MDRPTDPIPAPVPEGATQAGEVRARWAWADPSVWTERMLAALDRGVKGGRWFSLIDTVYAPRPLRASFARVKANGGAPGVDHVTIDRFPMATAYLRSSRPSTAPSSAGSRTSSTATGLRSSRWTAGYGCGFAASCARGTAATDAAGGGTINAGRTPTSPRMGCSRLPRPMRRSVSPLGGNPPTGEPCAGDPHARFGGRGGQATGLPYPYRSRFAAKSNVSGA